MVSQIITCGSVISSLIGSWFGVSRMTNLHYCCSIRVLILICFNLSLFSICIYFLSAFEHSIRSTAFDLILLVRFVQLAFLLCCYHHLVVGCVGGNHQPHLFLCDGTEVVHGQYTLVIK